MNIKRTVTDGLEAQGVIEGQARREGGHMYVCTSAEWGEHIACTLRDYEQQAALFSEMEGKPAATITADERHVYADGDPIADAVPGLPDPAAELARLRASNAGLAAALADLDLRACQARIASNIGRPSLKKADVLRGELERIQGVARAALAKAEGRV
jgi:hypothetical protein